ncbi:O-antigen ligase family protein [Galbibacter sp. PAP.153]|uniref:O-antigen ligase family protein n=1 Tax=Galbibacter sp. PAP.153 TaxID=3104623 RepID=UPI00300832DD
MKFSLSNLEHFFVSLLFFLLTVDNKFLPPLLVLIFVINLIKFDKRSFIARIRSSWKYYSIFVILFFALSLSIFWTEDLKSGFDGIERRFFFVVAPFLFLNIELTYKKLIFYLKMYILGTMLASSFFLVNGILEFMSIYSPNIKYPFYAFLFIFSTIMDDFEVHRAYFSVSVLLSIVFLFGNILLFKRIKWLMIFYFIIIVLLFQSKMSILILISIFSAIFVIFFIKGNYKFKIIISVFFLSVLFLTGLIMKKRFDTMLRNIHRIDLVNGGGSTIERIQYFNSAITLINRNYWGYGIGDVKDEMSNMIHELNYKKLAINNVGDPHNEFLNVFLISGCLGFGVLLLLFWKLFKYSFLYKNWILFSVVWIFFCSCMTESYLSRQGGILPFLIFSCLLYRIKIPATPHVLINNKDDK